MSKIINWIISLPCKFGHHKYKIFYWYNKLAILECIYCKNRKTLQEFDVK